ncbi:MAG: hypothetical protein U9Q77_10225 [Candidatus Marinimicrobia bacterium]|nr:hypothetical protein [Candidatus Neomarinimicrobiota bacterium]
MNLKVCVKHLILSIAFSLAIPSTISAQWFELPTLETFISDTLYITIPQDSTLNDLSSEMQVQDSRAVAGNILGIRQTKIWKYIPVDQYLAMNQSLAVLLQEQFASDSLNLTGTLQITDLILWTDSKPVLDKGLCLNAYTTYHDSVGNPVSDWMWEIRLKKKKKQEEEEYLREVVQTFLAAQSQALSTGDFNREFYPHLYRRQLMTWSEFIFFADGYAINTHLTLDFPTDQQTKWVRGSPGVFYRKAEHYESLAIGGWDQQWFRRLSPNWVAKTVGTFRFGFNNFERSEYTHLDYWNLFYVNLSGMGVLEYHPVNHTGLYASIGFYQGMNILPDVIPQFEPGLFFSLGVLLP